MIEYLRFTSADGVEHEIRVPDPEETREDWWYATQVFDFIIGLFKWLCPSYYTLGTRAFSVWFEKSKPSGHEDFFSPACGLLRTSQKVKLMMYLFRDPSNEKVLEFIQHLLDGDAVKWTEELS
jgi:hypothetical protein